MYVTNNKNEYIYMHLHCWTEMGIKISKDPKTDLWISSQLL